MSLGPLFLLRMIGIGKWLREAATTLLRLAGRYPWQAALIASLCLSGWLWHGNTKRDRVIAKWEAAAKAWQAASDANRLAAIAQVKAVEAKSAGIAKEADNDHAIYVSEGRAAVATYAGTHRVQFREAGISTPAPAPGRDDPGVPDEMPTEAFVAIRERDLQDTADLYAYALAAHNHAMDRIEAGLAKPPIDWPEPSFEAPPKPQ